MGWFEWRRIHAPVAQYAAKKLRGAPHWRIGSTLLLSHPGCLLSYLRPVETMIDNVIRTLSSRRLTVLVTHWWEYFSDGSPMNSSFGALHETAAYLRRQSDIQVVSFAAAAAGDVPLR